MVNAAVTTARDAERALVVGYAPAAARDALTTLFALDRRLGELAAAGREPVIAQMRLAWWREALRALDTAPPPPEPLLTAVADGLLRRGVSGAGLAGLVDGWEAVLDDGGGDEAIERHAAARGGALFAIAAHLLGGSVAAAGRAGEAWALADLARRSPDRGTAGRAAAVARQRLLAIDGVRWPRALRPLGALALLARADLAGIAPASPRRVARLAWHRLTGR